MTATVQEVKERLAALELLIEGVNSSNTRAPRSLVQVNLPTFVNRVADATYSKTNFGEQITQVTRLYRLELYVTTYSLGIEAEAEERCEPFIDRVGEFFLDRIGLELNGNDAIVHQATLESDTGVAVNIPYPGTEGKLYAGILFNLRVSTLHKRSYKR